MTLCGDQIIASAFARSSAETFAAIDPGEGAELASRFSEATAGDVELAVTRASEAFTVYRKLPLSQRADFLVCIADELQALGDALIARAGQETALPQARLEAELQRTVNQLKMFADHVRRAAFLGIRCEQAEPERSPQPKPELRTMNIPLGPVAVFGASNFPLAFSVAGGDTASALAAGCPVIVKGHPAHPGTGELAGQAIMNAVKKVGIPAGVFSLLQSSGHAVGAALVRHPQLRALAFTGSLAGGRALFDIANSRAEPIPVYAEMGSINPVFLLPSALTAKSESLADGLATSITLGVGQFCTAPGLVVLEESADADSFLASLAEKLDASPDGTMLHQGIKENVLAGVNRLASIDGVSPANAARNPSAGCQVSPALFVVDAKSFVNTPELKEEVFGPVGLVVVCASRDELLAVADSLPGQLTATIHADNNELSRYTDLLSALENRAGRLVFNGFPTGVEVCPAMHHGGPYPATTDGRSTSVGTEAVMRFLRPVCYQNFPAEALPQA